MSFIKDVSVRNLRSFGDVAAEEDAVLDYFLKTEAVSKIEKDGILLVLGRKGSGKTALVRYFSEASIPAIKSRKISLQGYPWQVHESKVDNGASPIEAFVASWKYLISLQAATLALANSTNSRGTEERNLTEFLKKNYGGLNPTLAEMIKPSEIKVDQLALEPAGFGFKLGKISFQRSANDLGLGAELNAVSASLIRIARVIASRNHLTYLQLHFDELDQGLSTLDQQREKMLIGLTLAARSVKSECDVKSELTATIRPIVYLRTDLWDELRFSDKNKITQGLALTLEWTPLELQNLIDERIKSKLGSNYRWASVASEKKMRGSQPKFNHVVDRTFLRPRDVIKFLNAALEQAKLRSDDLLQIENEDIVAARSAYSKYLKNELDDEIVPHWPHWEEALQSFSGISTITFKKNRFVEEYKRRRSADNKVDADEALKLLYGFSVVGYDQRSGYGGRSWAFQYTSPEAGWDSSAIRYKVHLGLKEFAKLREERT